MHSSAKADHFLIQKKGEDLETFVGKRCQ